MAKERKKIGLIFSYDERWIAGAYYIFNLVHALKTLPDELQPTLVIFTNSVGDYEKLKQETKYPYTSYWPMRNMSFVHRVKKFLSRRLRPILGRSVFDTRPTSKDVSVIFPLTYTPLQYFEHIPQKIFWIPDFQENFYPEFFSEQELKRRKGYQEMVSKRADAIVFSSNTAKGHYENLYPANVTQNHVIQFAVTHNAIDENIEVVKHKYGITGNYFLCSNQFWMHKNHTLILKALADAVKQQPDIRIVFTGKGDDRRNPHFYPSLLEMAKTEQIESNVFFLGLIPRMEQLCLLKNAISVIQPSLFEGWSTIIEDAKALQAFVIASSIDVHKEQLIDYPNSHLVSPSDPTDLAGVLIKYYTKNNDMLGFDYTGKIRMFGTQFIKIASEQV